MQKKRLENFPITVHYVPFVGYSKYPTNIDTQPQVNKERHIVIAGKLSIAGGFHEFIVDDDAKSIKTKSFENDYNKKYGSLQCIGEKDARYTHSYLVEKNKYLVVFYYNDFYNVYDMINDKWMLNQYEKKLSENRSEFSRSVLINDEIIIISKDNELYFYFIGNDHITNPILIHKYTLKASGFFFDDHGMCIINFIEKKFPQKEDDEKCQSYKFKIILFGQSYNKGIVPFFLYLDTLLSYNNSKVITLSIDETLIDENEMTLRNCNMNTMKMQTWDKFGFECILNGKNEPIIVIIGGAGNTLEKDIYLFNCVTHEFTPKKKVCNFL